MPKITVDGKELEVADGSTVLQACEEAGAEIPRFCYHERLSIAGNCRMCLVKMEKSPKPVASCAQPVMDGMVVYTNTPEVKKMREGVMEFLLINHPLDCPICDQGGECDLQDQAMAYGKGYSRFDENKRAVDDKNMGPLVKTTMTRCIHCTRCVRFIEDVAGTNELGAVNRGEDMEISTYIEKSITSELSGNIIDLCPVGALTSKPYAFKARPWELEKVESIDIMDAVGSNIRVDYKGREVMRVLPRVNEDINEEWISDKTRFSCDGLKYQRLDRTYIRNANKLEEADFEDALSLISDKISDAGSKVGAIAGDLSDVETMYATKQMLGSLGSKMHEVRFDGNNIPADHRADYTFNTTIAGIEEADFCLIVGANPRIEATILNARIRKSHCDSDMDIALIGNAVDLTYPYKHLGNSPWVLKQLADGQHPFCQTLKKCKKPMIIIGSAMFNRPDFEATMYNTKTLASKFGFASKDWSGVNFLAKDASFVGGMDIGFVAPQGKNVTDVVKNSKVLFLLGADDIDLKAIPKDAFVVYIGHHGDAAASRANIILPAAAYTEKSATYVNLEGRVQRTMKAVSPVGDAMEDWKIIAEIAKVAGNNLGFDSLADLRKAMFKEFPHLADVDTIKSEPYNTEPGKRKDFTSDTIEYPINNYYMTNSISRASKTMANCVKDILGGQQRKVA